MMMGLTASGAGISVQAGIPDFRSAEGLFQTIKRDNPREAMSSGKELFDVSVFNVSVFSTFAIYSSPMRYIFYASSRQCTQQRGLHLLTYLFHFVRNNANIFMLSTVRAKDVALLSNDRATLRLITDRRTNVLSSYASCA